MPDTKPSTNLLKEIESDVNLFELSPEAVVIIDNKGYLINANYKMYEWLGYKPEEIRGLHLSKFPFLSKKQKIQMVKTFAKRIKGENAPPYELEFIAKDKSKVIGLIKAVPIKNKETDKVIADLVMVADITEQKKNEKQLKQASKEFERLNKLMVGRELKMAELKREIKNLKSQKKERFHFPSPVKLFKSLIGKKVLFQIIWALFLGTLISLVFILFHTLPAISLLIFVLIYIVILLVLMSKLTIVASDLLNPRRSEYKDSQKAVINLLEDISEEKAYEEIMGRSVLENIGEGIVVTNEKGIITYINPALKKSNDFFTNDLVGKDFAEAVVMYDLKNKEIPVPMRSDSAAITANNKQMKVFIGDEKSRSAFLVNAAPIRVKEKFRGVIRVVHDISEQVKIEQQKDDFFSIASHELRTPLTVIAGNIDIILQGYGKSKLSDDDSAMLHDVATATDRLIKMVNEFLNVSRLDQGRLEIKLEEVDICDLTKQVIEELQPLAKEHNLTLKYSCPVEKQIIKIDETRYKEIIINLVGNSIKFTKKGGISVDITTKNNWLIATITDTGMGIDKDQQGKLFERFQQAMTRTLSREAGGTGLGLYISREFARLMGGDLELISSEKDKGSSFALKLPLPRKK